MLNKRTKDHVSNNIGPYAVVFMIDDLLGLVIDHFKPQFHLLRITVLDEKAGCSIDT
jgi:hypothetical protein